MPIVTTTIVSTVREEDGEIVASHAVEVDGPDDMPLRLLISIHKSAARAVLNETFNAN